MWHRYTFVLLIMFLPLVSGAQLGGFQNIGSGTTAASISLDPGFPGPGESFTATIEDFSGAAFGAQITWSYNGEVLEAAANQRSVELTAGAAGSNNQIEAIMTTPQGTTKTISNAVNPIYIDIIFEPQTRVPDWYLGRALPSYTSQINATALINNGTNFLDPNNLVYKWEVDREVLEGGTIRGGNKVSFDTPRGDSSIVVVTASDTNGNTIARRGMKMTSVRPDLEYYEKHSLYGINNRPLQSGTAVVGNVLTLRAEPFNLDTRVYNRPDVVRWDINSVETDNGAANPYEITLTRAGVGGGTMLNFHVRSLETIRQGTEDTIRVNF